MIKLKITNYLARALSRCFDTALECFSPSTSLSVRFSFKAFCGLVVIESSLFVLLVAPKNILLLIVGLAMSVSRMAYYPVE